MAAEKEGNAECREPCSSAHFASDHRQPPIRFTMFTTADYYYHCAFFSTFCLRVSYLCVYIYYCTTRRIERRMSTFLKKILNDQREKEKESYYSMWRSASPFVPLAKRSLLFSKGRRRKREKEFFRFVKWMFHSKHISQIWKIIYFTGQFFTVGLTREGIQRGRLVDDVLTLAWVLKYISCRRLENIRLNTWKSMNYFRPINGTLRYSTVSGR